MYILHRYNPQGEGLEFTLIAQHFILAERCREQAVYLIFSRALFNTQVVLFFLNLSAGEDKSREHGAG